MSITLEDCKKVIERYTKDASTVLAYKVRPLSESPVGFLGDHFRLKITYKTPQNRLLTAKFFLKTIPQGNANHTEYVTDLGVFKKEALIYKSLLNEFQKHHDHIIAAKSLLVNPKSFIILEDLSLQGFSMVNTIKHEDMVQVMKTMARFHSSTIIYEEQRSFPGKPYRLIDQFGDELKETTFSQVVGAPRYKWARTTSQAIVDTMLLQSADNQTIGDTFLHFARERIFDYVLPSKTHRNVMCHADLWKNNIMFQDKKCVFIDFQLVRYTPPAIDILTSLHVNCTTAYLDKHKEDLLQIYYDTFKECLVKHSIDAEQIMSQDEFYHSIREYEIASLTEAAMFGTIVFIGENLAQELASDENTFDEFTYSNRSKYVLSEMKYNPHFKLHYGNILNRLIDHLKEKA